MERTVLENYKIYSERINLYKKLGYDTEKERGFILEKARSIYGKVLEVGTGKGYATIVLAKQGYKFTSIDISEEEQKFARLNLKYFGLENNVDFKIGDAADLKFKDNSFDVIVCINLLHHILDSFQVIDEFRRVVSSKGKIILSDFSKEGLAIVDRVHASEGRKHEVIQNNLTEIENYLAGKDFKTERHRSKFQEVLIAYR